MKNIFGKMLIVGLALAVVGSLMADQVTLRAQADKTIGEVLRGRGAHYQGLPENGMAAVGPLSLSFDPQAGTITVAMLILESVSWTVFPERRKDVETSLAALDNPEIGGMFDTAGGTWMFDEDTGKLRLGFGHPADADADALRASIEALEQIGPEWALNWIGQVGMIAHGQEKAPSEPVTLENNPYR